MSEAGHAGNGQTVRINLCTTDRDGSTRVVQHDGRLIGVLICRGTSLSQTAPASRLRMQRAMEVA